MKLRSGRSIVRKGKIMEEAKETATETECSSTVRPVSSNETNPGETASVSSMLETVMNQLNLMNRQWNERIEGLKSDLNNSLITFQRELRDELTSKQEELRRELQLGISEFLKAGSGRAASTCVENVDSNVLAETDGSGSKLLELISNEDRLTKENVVDLRNSNLSDKLIGIGVETPVKTVSLSQDFGDSPGNVKIQGSKDGLTSCSKPVIVPCTVLPATALHNIPVLTVAPNMPLLMSPVVQQPVRPLRHIKPKMTTEDYLLSDNDGRCEDQVQPTRIFPVDRLILPRHPRVRTRGGIRRNDFRPSFIGRRDPEVVNGTLVSSRGGRQARTLKKSVMTRRKSERLKNSKISLSKEKDLDDESLGDTPLEEFLWGSNDGLQEDPAPENTHDTDNHHGDAVDSKAGSINNVKNPSSLSAIPTNVSDVIQSSESAQKNIEFENESQKSKEDSKMQLVKETGKKTLKSVSEEDSFDDKHIPKETPRQYPVKKGLSLSSPRKGSHIRALDFATPVKLVPSRKANTSPKAVSQVKLAQMRSLRRANLFKSPVKKSKTSWDADLRAFIEPDIPLSSSNMRKRTQPKRPGRPAKFFSPKKKMSAIKKKRKMSKTPIKCKNESPFKTPQGIAPVNKLKTDSTPEQDSSPKTADELVKQIERDVLEVLSENASNCDSADDGSSLNDGGSAADNIAEAKSSGKRNVNKSATSDDVLTKVDSKSKVTNPVKMPAKAVENTPAKLNFAGLITSNMMTPVSKILKEQSSLLDSFLFLTPSFLPTPDSAVNLSSDVRKAGTPSPSNSPLKCFDTTLESDCDENPSTPIKECSVRIEEALAAEERVIKPLKKTSTPSKIILLNTPLPKSPSPSKSPQKHRVSLRLASKQNANKSVKKKSKSELIIDQCLKDVEKDLFGKRSDKSPSKKSKSLNVTQNKSKSHNKTVKQNVSVKKVKQNKTPPSVVDKAPKNDQQQTDIKVPSFKEMMSRLSKMNRLSSTSSDSSDSSDEKKTAGNDGSNSDSFPKFAVSEDDSSCSVFRNSKLKTPTPAQPVGKAKVSVGKVIPSKVNKPNQSATIKEADRTNKSDNSSSHQSSSRGSTNEQFKDFSYTICHDSTVKDCSFDYFDEGKGDKRMVKPSPLIHLFELPLIESKDVKSNSKSNVGSRSVIENDSVVNVDVKNNKCTSVSKLPSVNKTSPGYSKRKELLKLESQRRSSRDIRSVSREPRYSLKVGKVALSSHRSRHYDRGMVQADRYYRRHSRERHLDSSHRQYKWERVKEYRRKDRDISKTRRSPSPRDRLRNSKKDKENSSPDRWHGGRESHEHLRYKLKKDLEKEMQERSKARRYNVELENQPKVRSRNESKEIKSNRISSKDDKNILDSHNKPQDPRLCRKESVSHSVVNLKPLAESTPSDKGKDRTASSNFSSNICPRKLIRSNEVSRSSKDRTLGNSAESLNEKSFVPGVSRLTSVKNSFNSESPVKITGSVLDPRLSGLNGKSLDPRLRGNVHNQSKLSDEGRLSDDDDDDALNIISQEEPAAFNPQVKTPSTMYSSVASPVLASPLSPPGEVNLQNDTNRSSSVKRKIDQEREEGEISDDDSSSSPYQQYRINWTEKKRRKLSDIPEADDSYKDG